MLLSGDQRVRIGERLSHSLFLSQTKFADSSAVEYLKFGAVACLPKRRVRLGPSLLRSSEWQPVHRFSKIVCPGHVVRRAADLWKNNQSEQRQGEWNCGEADHWIARLLDSA